MSITDELPTETPAGSADAVARAALLDAITTVAKKAQRAENPGGVRDAAEAYALVMGSKGDGDGEFYPPRRIR